MTAIGGRPKLEICFLPTVDVNAQVAVRRITQLPFITL